MQTFLFTDIESSTRLWEEHADEMPRALARHDELLRNAVSSQEGRIVKTTGDGMVAVFPTTRNAVGAALEGQRALGAEPWESTGPLRVRMGIHAGDTEIREGDFFGPAMNRTARIMAAGHGGQVLLSATAAGLVDGDLPEDAALRDLGTHRLRDLTLPEQLYQLVHQDIQTEFPAPKTLDTRPNNLPLQTTEFLGRESELDSIGAMMESPSIRLLTIAGPGGAGKTRLALQVAAEQMDRHADGVFFIDLSAERDPNAAFEAVVRALDLPVSGNGDSLQVLKMRLRDRQMLLVLDNLEQVTTIGPGLDELLQQAPKLEVVVTSRETLRVRAEHVFPIPPMSLPHPDDPPTVIGQAESVQLFAERARAVRPDFALGVDNAATIAEICLRLDGLPLAIELAAARLNIFTPADLLSRLRERLDVLGAGGRDLPDRQRTLWGAIGWSYELLDDTERVVLEMISVFSSARLEALETVAAEALGESNILDVVASLVDKSLVRTENDGPSQRFSMLQMIKEYARERLAAEPDRDEAVRRAHAGCFSGFAAQLENRLHGPDRQIAIEDLAVEIGNLRTAWRYWVDRGDIEQLFGLLDGLWVLHEAKGWYHAAIELATDTLGVLATAEDRDALAEEELTVRTSLARALMAVQGYGPEVEEAFNQVLDLSERAGSAAQRFPVLRVMATYYIGITDFAGAADIGRRLLELAERENAESIRAEAYYVLGAATTFMGDLSTGLPYLDKAIELYDPEMHGANRFRLGPNTAVVARVASGLTLWQCGDLGRALDRVGDALGVARRIEHPFSLAYALYHNGFLAWNRGRFEECLDLASELAVVADENEYAVWRTLATVLEGVALAGLGKTEEGLVLSEAGVDLYRGLTTPPIFWPLILVLRAQVHAMAGRAEIALKLIDEAIGLGPPGESVMPEHWVVRGDVLRMLPEPDHGAAEEAYQSAIRGAKTAQARLTELTAWTHLVELRRQMGQTPDGSDELADVYATFTDGFDEKPLQKARQILGREGI